MKYKIHFGGIAILFFFISCDINSTSNNKIATVKNNSTSNIACAQLEDAIMNDSLLYDDTSYMRYVIQPQRYDTYMVDDSDLTKAPNSAKTYLYILNLDSINKFRKLKLVNGILEHSLMKKVVIQLNKVREPVDTIYAR